MHFQEIYVGYFIDIENINIEIPRRVTDFFGWIFVKNTICNFIKYSMLNEIIFSLKILMLSTFSNENGDRISMKTWKL